jgi:transposase, IS30 family
VSFFEDCVRFGDQLAKLVDAGVPVREAAQSLGVSRQRAYAILRATGRPMGSPRPDVTGVDRARLAAVFIEKGSVDAAAKAVGVAHSTARRMLVEEGLVDRARRVRGKAAERARFVELLEAGWSSARAAREVGVNVRTARDWRKGVRRVGNTRVYSDGTVVDYASGTRYIQPVTSTAADRRCASGQASANRYLKLADRLVIADGLAAGLSYTPSPTRSVDINQRSPVRSLPTVSRACICRIRPPRPPRQLGPVPSNPNW